MPMNTEAKKQPGTKKSEETRGRILEAALRVFRERGFERATMREIAAEAGVALGAAYYYFESKEAIVMAFYERSTGEMRPALEAVLARSRTLETRLRGIIEEKFACFAPNPFFPINTLVLMRGAIAAQRLDVFGRYVDIAFRHMWARPKKLDDHAVLHAALLESSFDAFRTFKGKMDRQLLCQFTLVNEQKQLRVPLNAFEIKEFRRNSYFVSKKNPTLQDVDGKSVQLAELLDGGTLRVEAACLSSAQFLGMARGSNFEMQTQLVIAGELGYGSKERLLTAEALSIEVSKMLVAMMQNLQTSNKS